MPDSPFPMPGRFFAINPAARFPVMLPGCVFLARLSLRPSAYPSVFVPAYSCAHPCSFASLSSFYLCNPAVAARTQTLRLLLAENVEVRQQRVAAVKQQEFSQQQHERRDEQVLVLLVELLETHHRQLGLFHFVDALYDLVEADRLLGRTHIGAARDLGHLGEHLLVELRDDHIALLVLDELPADLDRGAFGRAMPMV